MGSAQMLRAGDLVGGRLKLRRVIGQGGMSTVWLARHTLTGAEVAVKLLPPARQTEETAERFRYEARIGATLAHRHICTVFDLIEEPDGTLALVMERLRGETLAARSRSLGTMSNREAIATMVPILSALQHAHDHEVIHRDLKPTNIFLHVDPDGHVSPKLFDFGIAKIAASTVHTDTGTALGTPAFMSPEQVRGQKLDARSDLFSAGVILYELVAGEHPFRGETASSTLAHVLEDEVDCHPAIDPKVWIEIQRALSKERSNRHPSASAFAEALCAAIGETPQSLAESLRREAPPVEEDDTATARVMPVRRRAKRTWIAIGGVSLASLMAAAGLVAVRGRSEAPRPAPSTDVSVAEPTAATNVRGLPPTDAPRDDRPSPSVEPSPSAKRHPLVLKKRKPGGIAQTPGF